MSEEQPPLPGLEAPSEPAAPRTFWRVRAELDVIVYARSESEAIYMARSDYGAEYEAYEDEPMGYELDEIPCGERGDRTCRDILASEKVIA